MLQVWAVTTRFQQRFGALDKQRNVNTTLRAIVATAAMALVCYVVGDLCPTSPSILSRLSKVLVPLVFSVATYMAAAKLLGLDELWLLFSRRNDVMSDVS